MAKANPLKMWSDNQLACRMGHSHPFGKPKEVIKDGHAFGTLMVYKCPCCKMVRHDVIDRRGELTYRRYFPPSGYSIKALETPTVQKMRLEYISRVT
jgi:hypothetical protein